ncbi:transposase [Streptomyces jumonjinensis]|uniref:transposase n=1 Tax=Streptomyces jumonjinensis TaxID=1945 RepID=UPI002B21C5CB|nr:transposase [Streptomyces jumonjinensis]
MRGGEVVLIDGTFIPTQRRTGRANRRNYSGKHRRHGLHFLALTDENGRLIWISSPPARQHPRHHRRPPRPRPGGDTFCCPSPSTTPGSSPSIPRMARATRPSVIRSPWTHTASLPTTQSHSRSLATGHHGDQGGHPPSETW